MGICARLVTGLLVITFLAACAGVPVGLAPEARERIRSYIVVSLVADNARFGYVGFTVLGNEVHLHPISRWGLDEFIESRLHRILAEKAGKPVVTAEFDRDALLKRAYLMRDVNSPDGVRSGAMQPNLELIRDDLSAIARKTGVDAVVLVTKRVCSDYFALAPRPFLFRESPSYLPVNGFGLYAKGELHNEVNDMRRRAAYLCASVFVIDGSSGDAVGQILVTTSGPDGKPTIPSLVLDRGWKFRPEELSERELQELKSIFQGFVAAVESTAIRLIVGRQEGSRGISAKNDR